MMAHTPSWLIRRSASALPTSGLPWLSVCTSTNLYPSSQPFLSASGTLILGFLLLRMSTAVSTAALQRWPASATGPVRGKMVPILMTFSCDWARDCPGAAPSIRATATAATIQNFMRDLNISNLLLLSIPSLNRDDSKCILLCQGGFHAPAGIGRAGCRGSLPRVGSRRGLPRHDCNLLIMNDYARLQSPFIFCQCLDGPSDRAPLFRG